MKLLVKGDIDGFFGLALDNLIQVLLIISLTLYVVGFPAQLVYGSILPGVAVSLLLGNLYYAWLAHKVAKAEGRQDVCALPYGINTPSVFVNIFLIMLPVKFAALAQGMTPDQAAQAAWQAGLVACLGSGVMEFLGAFVVDKIRQAAPRAALLSTLSGIALGFISLPFLYRAFAQPVVGFTTLAIVLITYFGQVQFRGKLPGGLVAVVVGTALCWITGVAPGETAAVSIGWYPPVPVLGELWQAYQSGYLVDFVTIIIPIGVFNLIGSIQNIESAEAAGDKYPAAPALAVNGLGSVLAALFGSCFPTTIYIGHPGWKAMGARAGYSTVSGLFMTLLLLSGSTALIVWAVPIEAGMAIVLWIGIIITAQAFQATPAKHAPAAVLGIMVGVGAFGSMMVKAGIRAADQVLGGQLNWGEKSSELLAALRQADIAFDGALAIEQGVIFSAMIFAAVTVCIIERQFRRGAVWCLGAAVLSSVGLMHSFAWSMKDAPMVLTPALQWAAAYLIVGALLVLVPVVTKPTSD